MKGGPIKQVNIAGIPFSVANDADVTWSNGGYDNEILTNGDQSIRVTQNVVPAMLNGAMLAISQGSDDADILQDLKDSGELQPCSFTTSDGTVRAGRRVIVDASPINAKNTVFAISLAGPGRWEKQ